MEFEISVPTAFYGKDMNGSKESFKKHYMYQVVAKKLNSSARSAAASPDNKHFELVDTVARRFQEFKRLHAVVSNFQ
jgi:spore germination cell wall hydrolase CwlJ-like protein